MAGLDGAWVQLGDQAGSTEYQGAYGKDAAASLAIALSRHAPTVRMIMSDDAVLHVELWRAGGRVARYGTMHLAWELFSDAEVDAWRGDPAAWAELLAPEGRVEDLAAAWELTPTPQGWRGRSAGEVLSVLCRAFGWDPLLVEVGWSHDSEGLYLPWEDFLEPEDRERFRARALTLAPPG